MTDDESSRFVERHLAHGHDELKMEKLAKRQHQQIKKIRRHRRTASTGSNMIYIPQKDNSTSTATLPFSSGGSKPMQQQPVVNIVKPKPLPAKQQLSRPGSAGSNPAMGLHRMQSPERIKETAHEVVKGITKLITDGESGGDEKSERGGGGGGEGTGERSVRMRRVKSGGAQRLAEGSAGGDTVGEAGATSTEAQSEHQSLKSSLTSSLPIGLIGSKRGHKHDSPRNKPTSKTSETTDTPTTSHPQPVATGTSSSKKTPGNSSRPSVSNWLRMLSGKEKTTANTSSVSTVATSRGGSGGVKTLTLPGSAEEKPSNPRSSAAGSALGTTATGPANITPASGGGHIAPSVIMGSHSGSQGGPASKFPSTMLTDLSRTPSMISTSSTISTFPPSTLPSRNPSFAYDGGGESSPHSLESVEIGDSIENLLALQSGRMNYSYFIPIRTTKDTTSSSDEDSVRGYTHSSRRKRSSGTTTDTTVHSTQQSKGWCS